jgi:hypothetical protein
MKFIEKYEVYLWYRFLINSYQNCNFVSCICSVDLETHFRKIYRFQFQYLVGSILESRIAEKHFFEKIASKFRITIETYRKYIFQEHIFRWFFRIFQIYSMDFVDLLKTYLNLCLTQFSEKTIYHFIELSRRSVFVQKYSFGPNCFAIIFY